MIELIFVMWMFSAFWLMWYAVMAMSYRLPYRYPHAHIAWGPLFLTTFFTIGATISHLFGG